MKSNFVMFAAGWVSIHARLMLSCRIHQQNKMPSSHPARSTTQQTLELLRTLPVGLQEFHDVAQGRLAKAGKMLSAASSGPLRS